MARRFDPYYQPTTSPALGAIAVSPSDTADLPETVRAVTIAGAGRLSFIAPDGAVCTTAALPAGTYSLFAVRIRATGTTATDITGWV